MPQEFPKNILKTEKKLKIGFDPKLHSEKQLNFLFNIKNIILKPINKNLIECQAALDLSKEDIKKLIINSFKSSFLLESKKKEWIEKI